MAAEEVLSFPFAQFPDVIVTHKVLGFFTAESKTLVRIENTDEKELKFSSIWTILEFAKSQIDAEKP